MLWKHISSDFLPISVFNMICHKVNHSCASPILGRSVYRTRRRYVLRILRLAKHTDPVNTMRISYVQVNQLLEYILQLRIYENVSTIYFIWRRLEEEFSHGRINYYAFRRKDFYRTGEFIPIIFINRSKSRTYSFWEMSITKKAR